MNRGKFAVVLPILLMFIPFSLAFAQEEKDATREYYEVLQQDYDLRILYEPTLKTLTDLGSNLAKSATLISGFIITIVIGWIAGRIAQSILKRVIKRWFEHETLLKAIGMDKEEFAKSGWSNVHNLIPFTVKWFVWLAFFIVAIDLLQIPQATNALAELWAWIPRIVVFIILVSVGFIISRIALKWMSDTKPEFFGRDGTVKFTNGLVQMIIFAIIFGIGITTLGIGNDIIPIFYWTITAGIMGIAIAIAVGLRHTARYWGAGETVKRDIEGATIKVGEYSGKVIKVGVTHTKLQTGGDKSKEILIPNEAFIANTIEITEKAPEKKKV